jgi:hypothetical protein
MVVCAVTCEPVSTRNSLIRAVLQGILTKNGLFCEFGPDFGSNDQRLSDKFPTFVNRELFWDIRDSSSGNSELLQKIRHFSESRFVPERPSAGDVGTPFEADFTSRLTGYM